jgi:Domain of unknown function (DUF4062)
MIRAFVSSTFSDLKDHRAYVIERLERSGIFVDPMEKWAAAGDEPKDLSTERVKACQLCVLLVGFRRGHVPEGGAMSIAQMEYAEALRYGLEVLVHRFQSPNHIRRLDRACRTMCGRPDPG